MTQIMLSDGTLLMSKWEKDRVNLHYNNDIHHMCSVKEAQSFQMRIIDSNYSLRMALKYIEIQMLHL